MKILVTGAAGFIGFYLVQALCRRGDSVVGIDNINDYYQVTIKYARLAQCGIDERETVQGRMAQSSTLSNYRFCRMDICDLRSLERLMAAEKFDAVINLAAQAGVRYSIENPHAYAESNVIGFLNILDCCRRFDTRRLVYASSSSVYGGNTKTPFSESDRVDNQVSIYAATKKSNELFASVYHKLYGLQVTGLRFFTVYGPWGRPDMAPMLFADAIVSGHPIKVFNNGNLSRDFTYIDDIIEGVLRVVDSVPEEPQIYNIGHGEPMQLMEFIHTLENALGREAIMTMLPMQPGDVYTTYADTTKLERDFGYRPSVNLTEGISRFATWYKEYFRI